MVIFAIAMAYVEAASVLYLRTLYGGIDPVGPRSPVVDVPLRYALIEIGREAATVVMLATVGWLAGQGAARFGGFLVAFGAWDIGYYLFLWLFTGWPASPLALDILFLIPLPWWGPVIAPALIALLMVVGGGLAMARQLGDGLPGLDLATGGLLALGAALCLAAFMADALAALPGGITAAFDARSGPFPWLLYLPGLALLAVGGARALTRR